jgi:hypothetical protein
VATGQTVGAVVAEQFLVVDDVQLSHTTRANPATVTRGRSRHVEAGLAVVEQGEEEEWGGESGESEGARERAMQRGHQRTSAPSLECVDASAAYPRPRTPPKTADGCTAFVSAAVMRALR